MAVPRSGDVSRGSCSELERKPLPLNIWKWYLAFGLLVAASYFVLPPSLLSKITLYNGVGISSVIALLVGIRRNRPDNARAWKLIAVGAACFVSADICYYVLEAINDTTPFPSLADLLYLSMYPLVISGLLSLLRRNAQRRDWAGLLDAAVVSVATFAVIGVLVMDTYITDDSLSFAGRLISLAYPVMDVALVAVAVRLAGVVHLRHPSFGLLTGGLCSLLVADTIYGVLNSAGLFETGGVADAFWMAFHLLIGAAALHPSSSRPAAERYTMEGHISRARLLVLCAFAVLVPIIDLMWGEPIDKWLTTMSSAVMFLLVAGRLTGLMRVVQVNESKARRDALHDPLTGLPNRVLFNDQVEQLVATGGEEVAAALFIDLDDFKMVNDSLGHQVGDELLCIVASRLQSCVRPEDVVARLSGDEFAVLLKSAVDRQDAETAAHRVQQALGRPFNLSGREVTISASVGVTVENRAEIARPENLLRSADAAMYHAKNQGKGRVEFFEAKMHTDLEDRLELKAELHTALERGEFVVYYQPIVDMVDRRITGVEALLRWQHPTRGMITPDRFIPLAEQSGLIVPIGRWVLREACKQSMQWRLDHPATAPGRVCVNLSARQLNDPNLFGDVADALAESGLEAAALTLELTESMLIEDTERGTRVLERLKAMNVKIAIDDFGTGYSSLSYLRRFSVNTIKIDRSFVNELRGTEESESLVKAIIDLARTIKVDIVAEGIETEAQYAALKHLSCSSGQGYHFARPLIASDVENLLSQQPAVAEVAPNTSRSQLARRAAMRPGPLDVQLLEGLTSILDIAADIDAFHDELAAPVTARLRWAQAWSEVHAEWEPLAFVVRHRGNAQLGALALLASRQQADGMEFVAIGDGPIAGALPLARGRQAPRLLARAITSHLKQLSLPWDLRITQLPEGDPVGALLAAKLPNALLLADLAVPRVVFSEGRSIDDYLSASMRRQIRRAYHRLDVEGHETRIDVARNEQDIQALLATLAEIHLERDRAMRNASDLDDPADQNFWRRVVLDHAEIGAVEITSLLINSEVAAYVIGLVDGDSYRVFDGHINNAFRRYSPGRLVEAAVLERALQTATLSEVDWMAGAAPEKILVANSSSLRSMLTASSSVPITARPTDTVASPALTNS